MRGVTPPAAAGLTSAEAVAILHQGMCGRHGVDGACHHPEHRSNNVLIWDPPYVIDPTTRTP